MQKPINCFLSYFTVIETKVYHEIWKILFHHDFLSVNVNFKKITTDTTLSLDTQVVFLVFESKMFWKQNPLVHRDKNFKLNVQLVN